MKKYFLFILFCSKAFCALAQTNFVTQTNPDEWKTTLCRHEFSVGWGDDVLNRALQYPGWWSGGDVDRQYPMGYFSPKTWFAEDTYCGARWTLGTQALSYAFRVKKWFWVGCDIIYTGYYCKMYDKFTHQVVGHNNVYMFAMMPKIRFSYFNRQHVMFYSGLSWGVGVEMSKSEENIWPYFPAHLTAFGVKAGADWFGFAELGLGYKGFAMVGVGYHFNTQRNKSNASRNKGMTSNY